MNPLSHQLNSTNYGFVIKNNNIEPIWTDAEPSWSVLNDIDMEVSDEVYKYLGVKQARKIQHQTMKTELITRFIERLMQVLWISISSRDMFKALNKYACSPHVYFWEKLNGVCPVSTTYNGTLIIIILVMQWSEQCR